MTTIERAARALVSWELGLSDHAINQNRYGANLDDRYAEVERRWPEKVDQVRAILQAIREPGVRMIGEGRVVLLEGERKTVEAYQAMIDAALVEGA